jgi:D-alanine-D-alanine ligase
MARLSSAMTIGCALDDDTFVALRRGKPARVSRMSYDQDVLVALQAMCDNVFLFPVAAEGVPSVPAWPSDGPPDVVVNLARSMLRGESAFAAWLEKLGVPFTGSPSRAIAICSDKMRSARLLAKAGVSIPQSVALRYNCPLCDLPFDPPFIVKPLSGGSSFGIFKDSVVHTVQDVNSRAVRVWHQHGQTALCDQFIRGREWRVGFVEHRSEFRIAGVSEWVFPNGLDGFKSQGMRVSKWIRERNGVKIVSPMLSAAILRRLGEIGNVALSTLGVRGYATLDLRVQDSGRIFVVEVNANPGLSSGSVIWGAPSFLANVRRIVKAALP